MSGHPVLEWTNPEGTRRVSVTRTPSGMFEFEEKFFVIEQDGPDVLEYWRSAGWPGSGLYSSARDAQNDAAKRLPWLAELLASQR